MKISDVIREEITDLKEVIESGDELVDKRPLDLSLIIQQTQLYERLEALKEELGAALYEETKEVVKVVAPFNIRYQEASYINSIIIPGDEVVSINWIIRG